MRRRSSLRPLLPVSPALHPCACSSVARASHGTGVGASRAFGFALVVASAAINGNERAQSSRERPSLRRVDVPPPHATRERVHPCTSTTSELSDSLRQCPKMTLQRNGFETTARPRYYAGPWLAAGSRDSWMAAGAWLRTQPSGLTGK